MSAAAQPRFRETDGETSWIKEHISLGCYTRVSNDLLDYGFLFLTPSALTFMGFVFRLTVGSSTGAGRDRPEWVTATLAEIANRYGMPKRTAEDAFKELDREGMLVVEKVGSQKRYRVNFETVIGLRERAKPKIEEARRLDRAARAREKGDSATCKTPGQANAAFQSPPSPQTETGQPVMVIVGEEKAKPVEEVCPHASKCPLADPVFSPSRNDSFQQVESKNTTVHRGSCDTSDQTTSPFVRPVGTPVEGHPYAADFVLLPSAEAKPVPLVAAVRGQVFVAGILPYPVRITTLAVGEDVHINLEPERRRPGKDKSIEATWWEEFKQIFTGPIPSAALQTFILLTPQDRGLLLANTEAWMGTKKYGDGFHDAKQFIKSGVWRSAPTPAMLKAERRKTPNELLDEYVEEQMREGKL